MHEHDERSTSLPLVILKNILTESQVELHVNPHSTLGEVIKEQFLSYNLNAFAYKYRYCGRELDLCTPLKDMDLGLADQLELARLGVDTSPYVPVILLVFHIDPY